MMDRREHESQLAGDPLWYKDAIIYQLHVRAFYDSNADGVGDFDGLAEKLDYLQDLGVTAIWILPFYPSPLKDDGYDISDYTDVHHSYGTLDSFRRFLHQAHMRNIRVITELVVNHTSDKHPWFQRSRTSPPGSVWRDFYVWSDSSDRYHDARIIFQDFETSNWTWDAAANAYYWHRFYSHQPDLNYDNPAVREAIFEVVDFWLKAGVDGLRLDAVPYLFEREGTNCENLPETHQLLRDIRRHVDRRFSNLMLLAEANQWPEDAAAYFGHGDECHMAFHFPLMPRMFMALRMEDRFPIIDILSQTPVLPEKCQWALFLRNHDELTLEMVTDEERDYMYRMYANDPRARINLGIRRRLAPLLEKDRRKIELMNGLLFSLPGTPVIYYGDEIGMGDNIYLGDRNGVRTPMQWSADRNAGFSKANPQQLYLPVIIDHNYHYEAVNVEARLSNPSSLYWWMKRLVSLRKRHKAFGRGSIEFVYPENHKVLAFIRRYDDEVILVTANLARTAQYVELDLNDWKGRIPVELLGQTEFPPIGDLPYLLTLSPYSFYWFSLSMPKVERALPVAPTGKEAIPEIATAGSWREIMRPEPRRMIEEALPQYLSKHGWFLGKHRNIASVEIAESIPANHPTLTAFFMLTRVTYTDDESQLYLLTPALESGSEAEAIRRDAPQTIMAKIRGADGEGILSWGLQDERFSRIILDSIARGERLRGAFGEIIAQPRDGFRKLHDANRDALDPALLRGEFNNTMLFYGNAMTLKLFRRVEWGVHPEIEMGSFLTEHPGLSHVPRLIGAVEYRTWKGDTMALGVLHSYVPNEGNVWDYILDSFGRSYESLMTHLPGKAVADLLPTGHLVDVSEKDIPGAVQEVVGAYLEPMRLLGRRTAELHMALADSAGIPDFSPISFTPHYQRALYQSMRNVTYRTFQTLRQRLRTLPEETREDARKALSLHSEILKRFRSVLDLKPTSRRIRVHGDYRLEQILRTGKDFVIVDFEGDARMSLGERRLKRSPLRDVADMLRSLNYAAYAALFAQERTGVAQSRDIRELRVWARAWSLWLSSSFLGGYLAVASRGGFLPASRTELRVLLDVFMIEQAVLELEHELLQRPEMLRVALTGLLEMLPQEG